MNCEVPIHHHDAPQVTFCKRKGGLFKKADDLSKLCGVEVAVIIVGDKKTCEYASTDMNRILEKYRDMQSGGTGEDTSETSRLWEQLESQRRELEALTRELASEKRKVEELRSSRDDVPMLLNADTNQTMLLPLASLMQSALTAPPAKPDTCSSLLQKPVLTSVAALSQPLLQELVSNTLKTGVQAPAKRNELGRSEATPLCEMSDDTAEVDSASEGTGTEEPSSKRLKVNGDAPRNGCSDDVLKLCSVATLSTENIPMTNLMETSTQPLSIN
jgi:hypothetical protein